MSGEVGERCDAGGRAADGAGTDSAMCGTAGPAAGSECAAGGVAGLPTAVFWDLDGTLIDSDPYWVCAERALLERCGGEWDDALAEAMQGAALPVIIRLLRERGVDLPDEVIIFTLTDQVMCMERERLPWIEGACELLAELAEACVPSVLVTGSPRPIVDNVLAHAPAGSFVGVISGDDDVPHKPDPAPYLAAARIAVTAKSEREVRDDGCRGEGVSTGNASIPPRDLMRRCVIFEDSLPGLAAAHASGGYVIAVTGHARVPVAGCGHYDRMISDYRGLRPSDLIVDRAE